MFSPSFWVSGLSTFANTWKGLTALSTLLTIDDDESDLDKFLGSDGIKKPSESTLSLLITTAASRFKMYVEV